MTFLPKVNEIIACVILRCYTVTSEHLRLDKVW